MRLILETLRILKPKSLDRFLSSFQLTWKPNHLAKSQVASFADLEVTWVALTSLFVFCIFLNSYIWHFIACFTMCVQRTVGILFIDKLCVRCLRLWYHRRLFTSPWVALLLHSLTSPQWWRVTLQWCWHWWMATSKTHCYENNRVRSKISQVTWAQVNCKVTINSETESSTSYLASKTRPSDLSSYLTQDRR